jgi:hypothetical protein
MHIEIRGDGGGISSPNEGFFNSVPSKHGNGHPHNKVPIPFDLSWRVDFGVENRQGDFK